MSDDVCSAFARLGLEARPWLDDEAVDAAWRERSVALHPDCGAGEREGFAGLATARLQLLDPARRIQALLGCQWPERTAGLAGLDADLEDLWRDLQQWLPAAREFAGRWQAARSALARALLGAEQMRRLAELQGHLGRVGSAWTAALERLRELDGRFVAGERDAALAEALERLRARFGWLAKWRAQLQELAGGLW